MASLANLSTPAANVAFRWCVSVFSSVVYLVPSSGEKQVRPLKGSSLSLFKRSGSQAADKLSRSKKGWKFSLAHCTNMAEQPASTHAGTHLGASINVSSYRLVVGWTMQPVKLEQFE